MPQEPLSIGAAAARLGISPTTLRRRIKSGEVAVETWPGRRGGTAYRVLVDTPDRLSANVTQPVQPPQAPAPLAGEESGEDQGGFAFYVSIPPLGQYSPSCSPLR
jgi:hypothetical protein